MWDYLNVRLDYLVRRQTFMGWEIRSRRIPNFEFVLILRGSGQVNIENARYNVSEGDFFFFRPGIVHSMINTGEPCMEIYGAEFSLPDGPDNLPLPDYFHLDSMMHLESLFRSMLDAYRRRQIDPMARWKQNLLMQQIIFNVFTVLKKQQEPVNAMRIRRVLHYINEDPFRPMDLHVLLEVAGIHKSLFLEQFRLTTGVTPIQYINGLRLENARDLLMETDSSVGQIAEQCGFADPFYFSRCFKKQYNLSPLQYRKVHAGE